MTRQRRCRIPGHRQMVVITGRPGSTGRRHAATALGLNAPAGGVTCRVMCRCHDDRRTTALWVLRKVLQKGPAIHDRHHQVGRRCPGDSRSDCAVVEKEDWTRMRSIRVSGIDAALAAVSNAARRQFDLSEQTGLHAACRREVERCVREVSHRLTHASLTKNLRSQTG
jgi:hypothetical protein